jgi:hypothetical protein
VALFGRARAVLKIVTAISPISSSAHRCSAGILAGNHPWQDLREVRVFCCASLLCQPPPKEKFMWTLDVPLRAVLGCYDFAFGEPRINGGLSPIFAIFGFANA